LIVYRALRPDVWPRLVAIDQRNYEVVREQGEPVGADGVFVIDRFDLPDRHHEAFLADWDAARAPLAGRRGYLGVRLYQDGRSFIEVGRWSSPLMVHRARGLLPPDPALYQVAG
jgi:hypothetical protein